jgi:hypothetical protein
MSQRSRKQRIAEVAAKKPPSKPVATFWITRDSDAVGHLSEFVDVWLARPVREPLSNGVGCVWTCRDVERVFVSDGDVPARCATWTLSVCMRTVRTIPEDDRQCIRIGNDPPNRPVIKA